MALTRKFGLTLGAWCAAATLAQAEPDRLFSGHVRPFAETSGKVVAFYLDGDAIARGYRVSPVQARDLTHLVYAFLAICGPDAPTDAAEACRSRQDFEVAAPGDDTALARYFARIKATAPRLKLLASIGGAMGSKPFFALTRSPAGQQRFVASAVAFLATHPMFDGLDIDWEFPTDSSPVPGEAQLGRPEDGQAYATLLHDLRLGLDRLGGSRRHYLLTSAIGTAGARTAAIDYRDAARDTDLFFAMTYDYYGPWADLAGHHAPVADPQDPAVGPVGLAPLLAAGIPPGKLVRGVAAYGRGWQVGPTGRLDGRYNGVDGSTEYRELAKQAIGAAGRGIGGFRVEYDRALEAFALWNPESRVYIGYDDPRAVVVKGHNAVKDGLAGLFAWELSGDNGDLLNAMNIGVGNRPLR
ncbi:hypothetical protein GCM10011611_37470 [Aliidongia dinghuensis]|uniref:chitinase n=1 Tax=Aliidongia dinghuensis TaxID=1867774 RepID=A0A8J2YWA8_9PROT|nr:glycosyl hydrolase family 18 protein [Aliidongia dinghuensis]GGF27960.1 hypothetical protein GCM10011611_37470 [Aliidongia dinghuensis]